MRSDLIFDHMDCAIGDDDIGPAIIVVVQERRSKPGVGCGRDIEPSHGACILELSALTKVAIKRCFFVSEMRDEYIFLSCTSGVCDIDAHACFRHPIDTDCHAPLKRFVAKSAVLLVYPKLIWIAVIGDKK